MSEDSGGLLIASGGDVKFFHSSSYAHKKFESKVAEAVA